MTGSTTTGDEPTQLRALLDRQAITDALHRYCRAVDRADIALLRSVYHEDAIDDHGGYAGGVAGFIDWCEEGWAGDRFKSMSHVLTNISIELDGDVARVESYVTAHHTVATRQGDLDQILGGRYIDRFERRAGEWRIAQRQCVWDWGRDEPATSDKWFTRVPGNHTFGTRDRSDPSYRRL